MSNSFKSILVQASCTDSAEWTWYNGIELAHGHHGNWMNCPITNEVDNISAADLNQYSKVMWVELGPLSIYYVSKSDK